jgi:hypothetical protein
MNKHGIGTALNERGRPDRRDLSDTRVTHLPARVLDPAGLMLSPRLGPQRTRKPGGLSQPSYRSPVGDWMAHGHSETDLRQSAALRSPDLHSPGGPAQWSTQLPQAEGSRKHRGLKPGLRGCLTAGV